MGVGRNRKRDVEAVPQRTNGTDSLHTLGPGGLHLFENAALESTSGADALQYASRINLVDNPSLVEISFPSLVEVTEFVRVEYNNNLPTCQIDRLQEQLAANGSFPTFIVSGNGTDDPAACE